MKCPYCGSGNTQCTNIGERIMARTLSLVAGTVASIAGPSIGTGAAVSTNKNICRYRKYICLDCKKEFVEERS